RLRLALHGPRDFLRYHIVATPNKARRDALPLEKLGEWDPVARDRALPGVEEYAGRTATRFEKRIEWNEGRIMWWLMEGGAKPTTRVVFLLEK
ncbi:30S ribosomal protein S16, partial [Mrakia frigida]|uniref:mitochondrial 37S ribosomal protein bS16m MRPS16 n=1 Tax=Mrakia frigida TaxID=29902 RepID=UPI003FCBF2B9